MFRDFSVGERKRTEEEGAQGRGVEEEDVRVGVARRGKQGVKDEEEKNASDKSVNKNIYIFRKGLRAKIKIKKPENENIKDSGKKRMSESTRQNGRRRSSQGADTRFDHVTAERRISAFSNLVPINNNNNN